MWLAKTHVATKLSGEKGTPDVCFSNIGPGGQTPCSCPMAPKREARFKKGFPPLITPVKTSRGPKQGLPNLGIGQPTRPQRMERVNPVYPENFSVQTQKVKTNCGGTFLNPKFLGFNQPRE